MDLSLLLSLAVFSLLLSCLFKDRSWGDALISLETQNEIKLKKYWKIIYKSVFNLVSIYYTPTTGIALIGLAVKILTHAYSRRKTRGKALRIDYLVNTKCVTLGFWSALP